MPDAVIALIVVGVVLSVVLCFGARREYGGDEEPWDNFRGYTEAEEKALFPIIFDRDSGTPRIGSGD